MGASLLILDGDWNSGRAVLQSLGRAGHRCCLAGPHKRSPAFVSRYAHTKLAYPDPLADKFAFQEWIITTQRQFGFDLILPVTEGTLVPLHEVREAPELRGVLALPPAGALEKALDKESVRCIAASLGIPTPPSVFVTAETWKRDEVETVPPLAGPWVLKPVHSKIWIGSIGTSLHALPAQVPAALHQGLEGLLPFGPVQVQQWVPGTGMGVEVLVRRGEIILEFAHERLHEYPLTGGGSTYRKSITPPADLLRATAMLMRHLEWHGVAMAEFRRNRQTGDFWLIEVNPRFWGSLPLALNAGADFPAALVALLLHDGLPSSRSIVPTLYARNFRDDLKCTLAILKTRRSEPQVQQHSRASTVLEWLRPLTGRERWDGAALDDPLPILHEIGNSMLSISRHLARSMWGPVRSLVAQRQTNAKLRRLRSARRILLLCHGNIYRSPYAGARLEILGRGLNLEIRSGGFHPTEGRTAPEIVRRIARTRGIELAEHRSRKVDTALVQWAELIVVMERSHARRVREMAPHSTSKTVCLGALEPGGSLDIPDPQGRSATEISAILERIDRLCSRFIGALAAPG